MELEERKEIAKQGLENLLSPETPSIVDMLLGRGAEKVIDSDTLIQEVRNRVSQSLKGEFMYTSVTKDSQEFLRKRILQSVEMVVLFIDLVGSTSMILNLPKENLTTIFSTFAQEMAYVIKRHEGYVLKFVGDAVIGFFVAEKISSSVVDRAVTCAESMLKTIKIGINPILKKNNLPELKVKIGLDYGENTIVRYGDDPHESHVDFLGPSINMAAKIQGLAHPDQILVGHDVFTNLHSSVKEYFIHLDLNKKHWYYRSAKMGQIYPVYAYVGK